LSSTILEDLQRVLPPGAAEELLSLARDSQKFKAVIARLCKTSFLVFQSVELGMQIGQHHRDWARRLATLNDIVEIAPRDHGKSMSLAQAYPLWKAKYGRWVRSILLLGVDLPTAIQNLDEIKDLLASKPSLRSLMPAMGNEAVNSRTELRLTNGTVIKAKGYRSPLRGRHPQLIIMDDVLNERNSDTQEARHRVLKHFTEVVFPMKDKGVDSVRAQGYRGQIVIVGTAQNKGDMYTTLQDKPSFLGARLCAITDVEKQEVLWPSRYSFEDLMRIKGTVGTLAFAKEYMNNPLTEETTIFPPSLFEPLKDANLSYVDHYEDDKPVFMGVDFSIPGSAQGDWTVILTMEFDPDLSVYTLLNYERFRATEMSDQITRIEVQCSAMRVTKGCLEDNMFQRVYATHFRNKSTLPLVGNTVTNKGKNDSKWGILSFRPLFENGRFRFPYKTPLDQQRTDHIVEEFNGIVQRGGKIGNEAFHDDVVMAMFHAMAASRMEIFEVSWD
jgi:hypothetical protein